MSRPRLIPAVGTLAVAFLAAAPNAHAGVAGGGASPNVGDMSLAFWIALVLLGGTALAFNAGLLVMSRRYRAERGREPASGRGSRGGQLRVVAVGGGLAAVLIVVGTVIASKVRDVQPSDPVAVAQASQLAQQGVTPPEGDDVLLVGVVGRQWLWRFEYPDPGQPEGQTFADTFGYQTLVVPEGRTVVLEITAVDVLHSWWVPELGPQVVAAPGRTAYTWFRADRQGVFEGRSALQSGPGYPAMTARVQVVSPQDYEAYVRAKGSEIREAQQAVQSAVEADAPEAEDAPEAADGEEAQGDPEATNGANAEDGQ